MQKCFVSNCGQLNSTKLFIHSLILNYLRAYVSNTVLTAVDTVINEILALMDLALFYIIVLFITV